MLGGGLLTLSHIPVLPLLEKLTHPLLVLPLLVLQTVKISVKKRIKEQ